MDSLAVIFASPSYDRYGSLKPKFQKKYIFSHSGYIESSRGRDQSNLGTFQRKYIFFCKLATSIIILSLNRLLIIFLLRVPGHKTKGLIEIFEDKFFVDCIAVFHHGPA